MVSYLLLYGLLLSGIIRGIEGHFNKGEADIKDSFNEL